MKDIRIWKSTEDKYYMAGVTCRIRWCIKWIDILYIDVVVLYPYIKDKCEHPDSRHYHAPLYKYVIEDYVIHMTSLCKNPIFYMVTIGWLRRVLWQDRHYRTYASLYPLSSHIQTYYNQLALLPSVTAVISKEHCNTLVQSFKLQTHTQFHILLKHWWTKQSCEAILSETHLSAKVL